MSQRSLSKTEPESARELDEIAKRLLLAAGVGDQLPTPQDDIVECANLVVGGLIDLEDYKQTFFGKVGKALNSGIKKLLGILDVGDRTIYINPDAHHKQIPFLKFHEVSHKVIPWQEESYRFFADDSYTLSQEIEEQFEKEANYLGSKILFQCERFVREARDYSLSLGAGIKLADDYGASYHSCLWNYASTHSSSCILLVLKKANYHVPRDGTFEIPYRLLYTVPSEKFLKKFGEIEWHREFFNDHQFTAVVNVAGSPEIYEGEVQLYDLEGKTNLVDFEAWSNTYNIFVLIKENYRRPLHGKKIIVSR